MKKREFKNLTLNKNVVSKFDSSKVLGGWITGKTGCIDYCDRK